MRIFWLRQVSVPLMAFPSYISMLIATGADTPSLDIDPSRRLMMSLDPLV